MLIDIIPKIRNIFVGRTIELQRLKGLIDLSCQKKEHLVYVFLNAPGVGKTTLIHHFGMLLEYDAKGIFIKLSCSSEFTTPNIINFEILNSIQDSVEDYSLFERYWDKNDKSLVKNEKEKLQEFKKKLSEILKQSEISIYDVYTVLNRLSKIIPIFFAADEIQDFQKIVLKQSDDGEETALHFFTRILKNLLNSRILLVLSGTRYHILSKIGNKIGSPIRQKVAPLIIKNFNLTELNEYVESIKELLEQEDIKLNNEKMASLLEHYRTFLKAFSGGHPRTIEKITEVFIDNLSILIHDSKYQDYDKFLSYLIVNLEELLSEMILSSAYKEALLEIKNSEAFSHVKKWILFEGSNGLFIGNRPKSRGDSHFDDEIKNITYELINIGILVQNGSNNYYITSYFHFLEFLKVYNKPFEEFLKQILFNKFFQLMCGHHSGFGYTFENIFSAALILFGSKQMDDLTIPLQVSHLRSIKIIRGKINWEEFTFEQNIFYQTPSAKSIDAFVLQENNLFLIQITTANPPDSAKVNSLIQVMDIVSKIEFITFHPKTIRGWLVSLFEFKSKIPSFNNLIISAGNSLIPILGKELYLRLRDVKESFSSELPLSKGADFA